MKKRNSLGNITHRRCNSCSEFKPPLSFTKHLGRSICEDCYVQLPNNRITRPFEMMKSRKTGEKIQIRWYDPKTFVLLKKRCTKCDEVKEISEFYRNRRTFDKYNNDCGECCRNRKRVNGKNK